MMRLSCDKSTDSLYIELRAVPARRTRKNEPDVNLDIGAGGDPVGCDIQHASSKRDLIMSIILAAEPQAAE